MRAVSPSILILLLAVALSCGQAGSAEPPRAALPPLPPDAERVAREFLTAFCGNDRGAISALLPSAVSDLYGPCLFARMPVLSKPRADGRVGAVDFEGPPTDAALPSTGLIVLRHTEQGGTRAWRIRQIYWYRELPREARIPDRSRTEADREQEPALRQAAEDYLRAWLAGGYETMDRLTFHWWEVPRERPQWVKLVGVDVRPRSVSLAGACVDFVARLKVVGLMPRTVRGHLWLVEENGTWRVRPVTFAFVSQGPPLGSPTDL